MGCRNAHAAARLCELLGELRDQELFQLDPHPPLEAIEDPDLRPYIWEL